MLVHLLRLLPNEPTVQGAVMSVSSFFYTHGILCASHPVEVLLTCVTGTVCLLTLSIYDATHPEVTAVETVPLPSELHVGSTCYFLALLCIYLQCRKLFQLRSKHLLAILAVFTVFSSLVFSSTVANLFGITVVREALPFFFLLSDFTTVCALAKVALTSVSHEEALHNIAQGMASLGPMVSLNTLVGSLVISIGSLSGVDELRTISHFGCLCLVTHYLMFMTFCPALLSLFLELCDKGGSPPRWYLDQAEAATSDEPPHTSNPVLQHVKLVMSAGLMFVHLRSWRQDKSEDQVSDWTRFLAGNAEQIVALVLAAIFASRYLLGDRNDISSGDKSSEVRMADRLPSHELRTCKSESDLRVLHNTRRMRTRSEYYPDPVIYERTTSGTGKRMDEESFKCRSRVEAVRSLEDCKNLVKEPDGVFCLSDEEVCLLVETKNIPMHQLEKTLKDPHRAVDIRRVIVSKKLPQTSALLDLPYESYDYSSVMGTCCENVIGYMPIPVGVAGPLLLDGRVFHVPMATTEGCLVASTNRGCRALSVSGGVRSSVFADTMTRGPVVRFPSALQASDAKAWLEEGDNFSKMESVFSSTSRFAKLKSIQCAIAGRLMFVRFVASTGDAMGMNMLSKGTEKSLQYMQEVFPTMEIISLSGNYCTDKKAAAINWIQGRGKSVVCEAIIPGHVVNKVLKTSVSALAELNISKNLVGSAIAGAMGGFNAHAANVVTALFIATGQDPAQNVSSSNCITLLEACGPTKDDLYISCTMPSLEVGTVGGGTVLAPQAACLRMLGVQGPSACEPGQNASQLAQVVCGTVLAAELSLLSALAAGHLVQSHLKHNRSTVNLLVAQDPTKKCAVL